MVSWGLLIKWVVVSWQLDGSKYFNILILISAELRANKDFCGK